MLKSACPVLHKIKVHMTRNFLLVYFKVMKNGVYFIVIAFFFAELFKILVYAN